MTKRNRALPALLLTMLAAAACRPASAADVYWDINGATPGAGGATPSGTWSATAANWSADSTGSSATAGWVNGDTAIFAAGTDATGAYTTTLTAALTAAGVIVEEGTVSLAGSALTIGSGTVRIDAGAKFSIPSTTNLVATAGANVSLQGGTFRSTVNSGGGSTFLSANATITVGAAGGTVETAGTGTSSSIYAGTILGPGNTLTKTGSGEFRYQGTGLPNTTFAKLIVNQGLYRLGFNAGVSDERGFGAVPASPTADAITLLNGAAIGTSFTAANSVLHVNRGITLGTGGGEINGNMTIPGAITGSGSLSHLTTGTLVLAGNSNYTGATIVTLGIVQATSANALGSNAGNTQVAAGAEFRIDGAASTFTTPEPFLIAGGGGGGGGAITIQNASSPTLSGPVTLSADATVTVSSTATAIFSNANSFTTNFNLTIAGGAGAGGGTTVSGIVAGTGGITKINAGTWRFNGNNTYTGTTAVNAGRLNINGNSSAATGAVAVNGGATAGAAGTLGGTGTVGGAVTVNGNAGVFGGTLRAGSSAGTSISIGTLTHANGLTMAAGSRFAVDLFGTPPTGAPNSGASTTGSLPTLDTNNYIVISGGTTTIDNAMFVVVDATAATLVIGTPYSFRVLQGGGDQSSVNVPISNVTFTGVDVDPLSVSFTGNSGGALFLNFTPVPEPTLLLGVAAVAFGFLARRRKD